MIGTRTSKRRFALLTLSLGACTDVLHDPPMSSGEHTGTSQSTGVDTDVGPSGTTVGTTATTADEDDASATGTDDDGSSSSSTGGTTLATTTDDGTSTGEPQCDPALLPPALCFRDLAPGTMLGGENPAGLQTGDLDDDGVIDLVTIDVNSRSVSTFRGVGDGWFWPGQSYSVDPEGIGGMIYNPVGGVLVDLDGDDNDELLVGLLELLSGKLQVFHGDGMTAMTLTDELPMPAQVFQFEAAALDIDDDGDLDVATNAGAGGIGLVRNGGGGALAFESIAAAGLPENVRAFDMRGDAALDVVVSHGAGIELFENQAGVLTSVALVDGPASRGALALGDLNGDGRGDVVAADVVTAQLHVRLGTDSGFGDAAIQDTTFEPSFQAARSDLELADLDQDGDLDLVVGGANDGVVVFEGDGSGALANPVRYDAGHALGSVELADFDGDGRLDIAGMNGLSLLVVLLADPCACTDGV